jgi:hypothetical protein
LYAVDAKQTLLVRKSVVCLSKSSGQLQISDSLASHCECRWSRYEKVFDDARGGVYMWSIQKFLKYINKNYYVLPGSCSVPSPSKQSPWECTHWSQHISHLWNPSWKCFFVRVFSTVCVSAWIPSTISNLRPFSLIFGCRQWKPLKEGLDPLEAVVEVPWKLPSDAASVHFPAVMALTSPQSYSCSVPMAKFCDMYHNLVWRCYRGLGWSVYDPAESDP